MKEKDIILFRLFLFSNKSKKTNGSFIELNFKTKQKLLTYLQNVKK